MTVLGGGHNLDIVNDRPGAGGGSGNTNNFGFFLAGTCRSRKGHPTLIHVHVDVQRTDARLLNELGLDSGIKNGVIHGTARGPVACDELISHLTGTCHPSGHPGGGLLLGFGVHDSGQIHHPGENIHINFPGRYALFGDKSRFYLCGQNRVIQDSACRAGVCGALIGAHGSGAHQGGTTGRKEKTGKNKGLEGDAAFEYQFHCILLNFPVRQGGPAGGWQCAIFIFL